MTARVTIIQGGHGGEPDVQVDLDLPIDLLAGMEPEEIAEACFAAVDEPQFHAAQREETLHKAIARAVLPRRELAQIGDMRGFMIGDQVRFGDVNLVCAPVGWER